MITGSFLYVKVSGAPLPATEWTISLWVYTEESGANQSALSMIRPDMALVWIGTKLRLYVAGIEDLPILETPGKPLNTWIHSIMGVHNGVSFGVVTIKDGTQYTLSMTNVVTFTSETIVLGTNSSPFVSVISKIGSSCRLNFYIQ